MLFSAAAISTPIPFGPYRLVERIGQGGMAVVYRAVRQGPNGFSKTVVVKAMLPGLSEQREYVTMFTDEACMMAALSHRNIVQVHDFGIVDGIPYLAMEHLVGKNLSQLRHTLHARGRTLPIGAAVTIAREMCHGLGYAHDFVDPHGQRRQIIHRDVSPSNVMVCKDGSVKLLDFGVAKLLENEREQTQSFKGKYAYMAPEQADCRPIDRRVDVYAAGIVLHELLAGKRLFAAATELETLARVSAGAVEPPSRDNPEVPRALDAIVMRALAYEPSQRYASGSEMAEALASLDAIAWPRRRLVTLLDEPGARLSVVKTPLPPPLRTPVSPVSLEPPRLFVLPPVERSRDENTGVDLMPPWASEPVPVRRRPTPVRIDSSSNFVWYAMAAAAIVVIILGGILIARAMPPALPELVAHDEAAAVEAAPPRAVAPRTVEPRIVETPAARAPAPPAPIFDEPQPITRRAHGPSEHRRGSRPHPPRAPEPTVSQGRIVDPFAGLK